MARVSTPTLLSLEQFGEILGYDPRHFQTVTSAAFPWRTDVDDFNYRYAWQCYTKASHEEIAMSIAQAEAKIASFIGFWPAPKYITEETKEYTQMNPGDAWLGSYSFNMAKTLSRKPTTSLEWKKYIKGGKRQVTLVADSAPVTYSDLDGDGFYETATIVVPGLTVTGWLPKEIGVYPTTDTTETERIRGLTVAIDSSSGTVTITGNSALFVLPILRETAKENNPIDGDVAANFLDYVNVYREYCSDLGTDNASLLFLYQNTTVSPLSLFLTTYGVLQPYNKERSTVSLFPATWDATSGAWVSCALMAIPNLIQMNYQAGVDTDSQGRMQPMLARAVAALATAMITKPVTSAGPPDNLQEMWQSTVKSGESAFGVYSCPWGNKLGAYEAYSIARDLFPEGIGVASA